MTIVEDRELHSADEGADHAIATVLEARGISKSFGGTCALDDVSVIFRRREVHAIVGENGAGKSTLVKVLSGFYPTGSYEGELHLNGRPLPIDGIHGAERNGIFLVPQDLQIVPALSIAENLFLNREPQRWGLIRQSEMLPKAAERLREFGFGIDPSKPMGELMPGEQQLVVIARAMMHGLNVLALDEPTASLTDAETTLLFQHIEKLKERGIAVIYISHRLDEITQIAQRVTVLRDGRVVDHLEMQACDSAGERIVRAMVGRDLELERRPPAPRGPSRLAVTDLSINSTSGSRQKKIDGVSFSIAAGEVLGVFGSVGCGADELAQTLFGIIPYSPSDSVKLDGDVISIQKPSDAIKSGIGYLPGNRQRNALFPLLPVGQNMTMLALDRVSRHGFVMPTPEAEMVHRFYSQFKIKAQSADVAINTLSGGNQQKAMLARVLSRDPEILILHEPTQGVDIATKQDVYRMIDTLAHAGKVVLLASSDLGEIFMMSDKVLVLKQGCSMGIWDRNSFNQHNILAAATGGN